MENLTVYRVNLSFLILDTTGEISIETKSFDDYVSAKEAITRFFRLFRGDSEKRVARVINANTHKVIATYDSETDSFTVEF